MTVENHENDVNIVLQNFGKSYDDRIIIHSTSVKSHEQTSYIIYSEKIVRTEKVILVQSHNQPVVFDENGYTYHYLNGHKHRLDGPAVFNKMNGDEEWYKNGKLHREDGPAKTNKYMKCWYYEGESHRLDGPAIITNSGGEAWFNNGKLHRLDGPALTNENGSTEWWIDGVKVDKE